MDLYYPSGDPFHCKHPFLTLRRSPKNEQPTNGHSSAWRPGRMDMLFLIVCASFLLANSQNCEQETFPVSRLGYKVSGQDRRAGEGTDLPAGFSARPSNFLTRICWTSFSSYCARVAPNQPQLLGLNLFKGACFRCSSEQCRDLAAINLQWTRCPNCLSGAYSRRADYIAAGAAGAARRFQVLRVL